MRRLLLLGSAAVLLAGAAFVPLPLAEISPGLALNVPPRVSIDHPVRKVSGKLLLTSVELSEPSALDTFIALTSTDHQLVPLSEVVPAGVSEGRYFDEERAIFADSSRVAAAVALRATGYAVKVEGGGAQVVSVLPGGPSDGKLSPGDVIEAAKGATLRTAQDLGVALSPARPGDAVTLRILRGDRTRRVAIRLANLTGLNRAGLGVEVTDAAATVVLPFPIRVSAGELGGPSAGLMMALSIYDLIGPVDLTHGRTIAGTGTIDIKGRVGPIGGIAEKVVTAERAGATIFLAPASQVVDARAAATTVRVIAVRSFADAVRTLMVLR